MRSAFAIFDTALRFAIGLSMAGIMLAICLQVVARGTIGALPWPEELSVILMIWGLLLAAAYVLNERGHVGITYFVERLGPKTGAMMVAAMHLLIILFAAAVIYGSIDKLGSVARLRTGALGISRAVPNLAIPVACALYIVVSIRIILESFEQWRNPG
ncbi:TRAP transporter small permease [Hoeflea sp. Naph1]|uniref:TRAP transporter small permease n=1 Tax=Hoeflea sp. Naph1 TaxID=3388653 RepID=UPI0039900B9D